MILSTPGSVTVSMKSRLYFSFNQVTKGIKERPSMQLISVPNFPTTMSIHSLWVPYDFPNNPFHFNIIV